MKMLHEIENWGLSIIDFVKKGKPIEDSRVELKSTWIEPEKAARRIAGHANASGGEPILWIIGIDQKDGIVGVNSLDYQDWYSKVISFFDGIYPDIKDITLFDDNKIIVCLYILTDRIPFVVRNPVFRNPGGGPVSLEVPWREGTMVKTASRNQLIQILSPLIKIPEIEFLDGYLNIREIDQELDFYLNLDLYFDVKMNYPIQIPFHRCKAMIYFDETNSIINLNNIKITPPYRHKGGYWEFESTSITIESTPDEVLMNGSGHVILNGGYCGQWMINEEIENINVSLELLPVDFPNPLNIEFRMKKGEPIGSSKITFYLEKY